MIERCTIERLIRRYRNYIDVILSDDESKVGREVVMQGWLTDSLTNRMDREFFLLSQQLYADPGKYVPGDVRLSCFASSAWEHGSFLMTHYTGPASLPC